MNNTIKKKYVVEYYNLKTQNIIFKIILEYFPDVKEWYSKYMTPYYSSVSSGEITKEQIPDEQISSELKSHIEHLSDASIFFDLISNIVDDSITIVAENRYVDREYRDSYYMHYSEEHKEKSRWCQRLLLFSGNHESELNSKSVISDSDIKILNNDFIGSIVIKPLHKCSIGRTLLSPNHFKHLHNTYIRKSRYNINYRELQLSVEAFPFRMRDDTTTSCAEVTLLNIFDYYSSKYNDYRCLMPSEIHSLVRRRNNDRTVPTKGLNYTIISKVLHESGFSPKLHSRFDPEDYTITSIQKGISAYGLEKPSSLFGYYVESGMPVGIGFHIGSLKLGHSVLCIGHAQCNPINSETAKPLLSKELFEKSVRSSSNQKNEIYAIDTNWLRTCYIIQDDASKPYSFMKKNNDDKFKIESNENELEIGSVVVPLHRRMYMDARDAVLMFRQIIYDTITLSDKDFNIPHSLISCGTSQLDPLIYRIFLASSGHYRAFRIKHIKTEEEFDIYSNLEMPHFVWVCELYNLQSYNNSDPFPFGEIVLDATVPKINYDSLIIKTYNNFVKVTGYDPFVLKKPISLSSYSSNLDAIKPK